MWSVVCAALVCGAFVSACGGAAGNAARPAGVSSGAEAYSSRTGPAGAAVGLPISALVAVDTGVVRVHGVDWFATAESSPTQVNVVRIYRWERSRWSLDGVVSVSQAPSMYGEGGVLTAASLTGSHAPDFTLTTGGTDWVPFAVISRVGGRWHKVPFDYGSGPTDVVDELGVRGKLVQAGNSPCGCANGSPTSTWYRVAGPSFVPTAPPGPSAPCTAVSLDAAPPNVWWFAGTDLALGSPVEQDVRAPFAVASVACADGWALATGTTRGERMFAIFEQTSGGRWVRGAVSPGSGLTANAEETALPVSLLDRLAARIGRPLRPARPPKKLDGPYSNPAAGLPGVIEGRGSASIPVTPGSTVATTGGGEVRNRPGWYAAAVVSRPSAAGHHAVLAVHVYRWRSVRWAASGTVRVTLDRQHGVGTASFQSTASFTGSRLPDFTVAQDGYPPGWLAVISHIGGNWHAVSFRSAKHTNTTATATVFAADSLSGGELVTPANIAYRFEHGAFKLTRSNTTCQTRFVNTPGNTFAQSVPITHLACTPGWALGYGSRHGKTIAVLYSGGSTWFSEAHTQPNTLRNPDISTHGLPPQMLTELEHQQWISGAPGHILIKLNHQLTAPT